DAGPGGAADGERGDRGAVEAVGAGAGSVAFGAGADGAGDGVPLPGGADAPDAGGAARLPAAGRGGTPGPGLSTAISARPSLGRAKGGGWHRRGRPGAGGPGRR